MKFSIVIPFFNHWKLVNDRLMELYRFLPTDREKFEVILVNDGSFPTPTSDAEYGVKFWQDNEKFTLRYKKLKKNQGFGYAMNVGAEISTGDVLVLLSNDVVVNVDFTQEIEKTLTEDNRLLLGGVIHSHDTGWNKIENTIIPYVEGWFVVCMRDIFIQELNGFDWITFGIADYEDIDLSVKAVKAGMKLGVLECAKNGGFRHMGAQTLNYSDDRLANTKANREKFIEKWSGRLNV